MFECCGSAAQNGAKPCARMPRWCGLRLSSACVCYETSSQLFAMCMSALLVRRWMFRRICVLLEGCMPAVLGQTFVVMRLCLKSDCDASG